VKRKAEVSRRGKGFVENEAYLNTEIFIDQFYKPVLEILGPKITGFIFEQEYHPKKDRMDVAELAKSLGEFFGAIPKDQETQIIGLRGPKNTINENECSATVCYEIILHVNYYG